MRVLQYNKVIDPCAPVETFNGLTLLYVLFWWILSKAEWWEMKCSICLCFHYNGKKSDISWTLACNVNCEMSNAS